MDPTDITIEILKSIRDEIRVLGQRQAETNERLDRHEKILEHHGQILERHEHVLIQLVRGQERHETALGLLITEVKNLGSRIDNIVSGPMGEKVRDLDLRVTALESRLGPGTP
jgi:hypothetical protein